MNNVKSTPLTEKSVCIHYARRITDSQYDKKVFQLKHRQKEIEAELGDHTEADKAFLLSAEALFRLASQISGLFDSSTDDQKRQIINVVFSNLSLTGGKLDYTLRTPFDLFFKNPVRIEWQALLVMLRTQYYKDIVGLSSHIENMVS